MNINELESKPRALVVGPGALGALVAHGALGKGFDVRFIGRGGPALVDLSLEVGGKVTRIRAGPPDAAWCQAADVAFLTVKAFDLPAALAQSIKITNASAAIIALSNGAVDGVVSEASQREPNRRFRLGFGTLGVSEVGPSAFAVRAAAGDLSFGPAVGGDAPLPVERALTTAPSIFSWHANILKLVRRKWIYNVVINSLTAARGLKRNGDLLHDVPMLAAVFNEACDLATALWGSLPLPRQELYEGIEQLISRTADNENSMARDVRLGRRTESELLAGLAKDGRRYPLLVDLHQRICGPRSGA